MAEHIVFDQDGYQAEYHDIGVYKFSLPDGQKWVIPKEFLEQAIELLEEANLHKHGPDYVKMTD